MPPFRRGGIYIRQKQKKQILNSERPKFAYIGQNVHTDVIISFSYLLLLSLSTYRLLIELR